MIDEVVGYPYRVGTLESTSESCGDFMIGKGKPHWVFLIMTDDAEWREVHIQYYTLIQSNLKTIHFEYEFIRQHPDRPDDAIEIDYLIRRFADADLIFLLNEHDFLNLGSLMNIDTICELYTKTAANVLCLRQNEPHQKFETKSSFIYVDGFKPRRNIP